MTDNWQPEPSPWLSSPPHRAVPAQASRPRRADPSPLDSHDQDPMATQMVAVGTVQPRTQRPPAQTGSVDEAEQILAQAIEALDAEPSWYSIGGTNEGAVCLIPEDGRWSVFLAEHGTRRYNGTFEDPEHAAVHFAGVLLLVAHERGHMPSNAPVPASSFRVDPFTDFLAGPPIEPLGGDPPVTLYTERRLTVLPPGTELDRFGDQEGNTLYAARTRYPHRSVPPDFITRDYRVYRLHDPLRAVTGVAVPWFGQPGGGIVYLLPQSIRELIQRGILTEIPAATVIPY